MAHLELKLIEGAQEPYVAFLVDGDDLGTRIKAALGKDGFDDVLPWPGGDYSPSDTVLGEEVRTKGAYGCYGCSGVTADVQVAGSTITLCSFTTYPQIVAPLGPVGFDRRQYEEAVARLMAEIEAWRPLPAESRTDKPQRPPLQLEAPRPDGVKHGFLPRPT